MTMITCADTEAQKVGVGPKELEDALSSSTE